MCSSAVPALPLSTYKQNVLVTHKRPLPHLFTSCQGKQTYLLRNIERIGNEMLLVRNWQMK